MGLFEFEKREIEHFLEYEVKIFQKFKEPLNYVINKLTELGHCYVIDPLVKINLNDIKEKEGKSYHWSVITTGKVTLVIRRFKQHLTIFTKVVSDKKERFSCGNRTEYGAFTFHVELSKFGEDRDQMSELYYSKPFTGLNEIITDLLILLATRDGGGVGWVWNSVSLKRPDYVDIKLAFSSKSISSLDAFVFCMEELSEIYLTLFAETTMITKLKEYENKTDIALNNRYKIGVVTTTVKDDYYHAVGLVLIDTMDKNKEKFQDVYSLSRYYFDDLFKEFYLYNGEVYILGDEFVVGEP